MTKDESWEVILLEWQKSDFTRGEYINIFGFDIGNSLTCEVVRNRGNSSIADGDSDLFIRSNNNEQ